MCLIPATGEIKQEIISSSILREQGTKFLFNRDNATICRSKVWCGLFLQKLLIIITLFYCTPGSGDNPPPKKINITSPLLPLCKLFILNIRKNCPEISNKFPFFLLKCRMRTTTTNPSSVVFFDLSHNIYKKTKRGNQASPQRDYAHPVAKS